MVDQAETPKILDEIAKASAKAGGRSRNQQNARRRFIIVSALFLLILGVVGYLGWQQGQLQQALGNLDVENQALSSQVESQNTHILDMQEEISQFTISAELEQSLRIELERLRQQYDDVQSQQLTQNFEPNSNWKLYEALFFLEMANLKLQLQGDIVSTIELIENADIALVDSGNNNVFSVRQALASNLAELRSIRLIDREGLFIRLGYLRDQAEQIRLLDEQQGDFDNRITNDFSLPETENDDESILSALLEFLASVFVLREWENTSELIFAAGQPDLIRQNLYLMLEQARFALIAKKRVLYKQSLANIKKWFERYGVSNSSLGISLLQEIDSLILIDIDPPLPNLNESLRLMNQLGPIVNAPR